MLEKRWEIYERYQQLTQSIAGELNLSPITIQILINRGMKTSNDIQRFFQTDLKNLWDPFSLSGMEKAVERLIVSLQSGERIVIFGDYDVDGITGTSLLWQVLKKIDANVDYYIPDRSEGYGLNKAAVQRLAESGYSLIVTVDNGISCFDEVELANSLGVDVIITDHHEPPDRIPNAVAVINPKLKDCNYPCSYLAGVGVGFKLCQALAQRLDSQSVEEYVLNQIDLVTLGTVADIVPLLDENRIIVANGLKKIQNTSNLGLRELIKVANLEDKEINTGHIGFNIGPRINAIGRLDNPMFGVELLTTTDPELATSLATRLDQTNRKRQFIEESILEQAIQMIEDNGYAEDFGIVLASSEWHAGIIGIVASKLVERYYRPIVLIALQDGIGKGSARGIRGINLYEALNSCKEYLIGFGGHEMAAGLSLDPEFVEPFREAFKNYARSVLKPEDLQPFLKIDAEVEIEQLDFSLLNELDMLAPHGMGNSRPQFLLQNVRHKFRLVGTQENHLKIDVFSRDKKLSGIGFGMSSKSKELRKNQKIDLTFSLGRNVWQGKESLQMMLNDLKASQFSLIERVFLDGDQILLNSLVQNEETDLNKIKQKFVQYKNERLFQEIYKMHKNHTSQKCLKTLENTLESKRIVKIIGSEKSLLISANFCQSREAFWRLFTVYHLLSKFEIACVIYPFRSQVNQQYEFFKEYFKQFGLSVYKATGAISSQEQNRLSEAIRDGEVNLFITTSEYLKSNLDRFQIFKERLCFFIIEEVDLIYNKLDFLNYEWKNPFILATTSIQDRKMVDLIKKAMYLDELKLDLEMMGKISIKDKREIENKDEYLLQLLRKKEKTLIYVNSPKMSVELARKLRDRLAESGEEIIYLHEKLELKDRKILEEFYQAGKVKFVVITDTVAKRIQISDIRHIIHYQLPFHQNDFILRCLKGRMEKDISTIHFIYGELDKKWNQKVVNSLIPSREVLAGLYKLFEKLADRDGQISKNKMRLIEVLKKKEEELIPSLTISSSVKIFQQIKLMEKEKLLPKPKQKLDLYSSIMYNEGIIEKKFFSEFWQAALNEDLDTLLRSFWVYL
ncbi:MAG: single-stranded-DNA-specific exonuclease RecJ [Halanaerobiales bacterium]|nr:single-stranded-DNA-specific exonuclease RecJ [Halanaerobiales bacterium]